MKIDIKKIFTPKLLTGLAVVGVIGVAVMAAKESPKAMEVMKKEPEEPVADNDKLKVSAMKIASVAWEFKGTIVVSGLTIACIIGSHKLSMKEIAALTATCGYLATNRDKLETEIRKLPGGEEALKAVKKEVMAERTKDILDEENGTKKGDFWRYQSVEQTGNGDLLCYDHFTGRYFRSSEDAVREAICSWNDEREYGFEERNGDVRYEYDDGYSINDLYSYLDLERSQLNDMYYFPQQHRININVVVVPVDRLDPVTMARYKEDLLVMEYADDSMPVDKARKLKASDIYNL